MLEVSTSVIKGIIFIRLEGELTNKTFLDFEKDINYLLYKQKMHYFVIDLKDVNNLDMSIFNRIQSKLVEIFLSCGKVVLCGLNNFKLKRYCCRDDIIFDDSIEALNYFYL